MEPMQPLEPIVPSLPPAPPRSTPIQQPGGFPGWGTAPLPPPGSPPPYGVAPHGMPFAPISRSYGLATAALVCGLLGLVMFWFFGIVPLLGLIFGLISAKAIKRSSGTLTGLGKARAGWITGLIGVAGAGVFMWAASTGRLDTAVDTDSNPNTSPYIEADVGDCVRSFPDGELVYELEFLSCDLPHGVEVYLEGELNPDGRREYPGDDAVLIEVEQACGDGFEAYVGRSYESSVFEVYYLYPRALGWKAERGAYFCFVGEVGRTTTGSAFQSDR
ncbi:MAG: DUF4190 domain-containing protein [Actinobacteria bacterium]|nr:DUF4190 domain-containing protein [Actinomycetota bacterium]